MTTETGTASSWVGRSVVDREGASLGACTAVVDDSRGQGTWLAVKGPGVSGFVPGDGTLDGSGQVQVRVTRGQVLAAPTTALPDRLSEFEEAALRRHYTRGPEQSGSAGPDPRVLGAAAAAVLALVAWLVTRARRKPPTRSEQLAEAGRTATTALTEGARGFTEGARGLAATAAPVAGELGHLAARSAGAGVGLAGRTVAAAAPVALTAAGTAAGAAAHGISRLASDAGELASGAGELAARAATTGQRVSGAVAHTVAEVPETLAEQVGELQRGWRKLMNRLTFAVFLGIGYVLGARAGRERYDDIARSASRLAGKVQGAAGGGSEPETGWASSSPSTTAPGGNTMG